MNRPASEDGAAVLGPTSGVAGLFRGLDFSRVDDKAGARGSIVQEVWRLFLAGMMVALVMEAVLCLPPKRPRIAVNSAGGVAPPGALAA